MNRKEKNRVMIDVCNALKEQKHDYAKMEIKEDTMYSSTVYLSIKCNSRALLLDILTVANLFGYYYDYDAKSDLHTLC
jgi:hypothetical protein